MPRLGREIVVAVVLVAMLGCAVRCAASAAEVADVPSNVVPRPISDVLAIGGPDVDRGVRVSIVGVITFRNFTEGLRTVTVDDGTGGAWVELIADLSPDQLDRLQVGTQVGVAGQLDRGGYAPRIMADRVEVHGEAPLPEAIHPDINLLFVGGGNGRRVEVRGIVQGVRDIDDQWSLVVDVASRRIVVRVPKALMQEEPSALVDAEVSCVGVIGSIRNTRGQFLSPILNVVRRDDVRLVSPAPTSPFESPLVPLSELALFSPRPLQGRRIRSEGVVTLAYPGRFFYLQDGLHGVRVETTSTDSVGPGDIVEVAGFLDMSRHIGGLVEALYRRRSSGERPTPVAIQPRDIIAVNETSRRTGMIARPGNYHGCLVAFTATLMEVRPPVGEWCGLTLSDGSFVLTASLPAAEFAGIQSLRPGSALAITGIADLDIIPDPALSLGFDPLTQRVGVLIQRAADVVVARAPPWWTVARLGTALALAVGTVLAVLAWNYLLHRQVMRQASSLAEQMRSRYEAEAEFQATLRERGRLAANLHDTVLQTVTGIGYQLKGMKASMRHAAPEGNDAVADIDVAQRMVDHAVQQLRGTLWAMHSLPLAGQSLPTALEALVQRLQAEHAIRIVLCSTGTVEPMPEVIAGNLFLVAQEAVYNALRHADAALVEIGLSFAERGTLTMRVRDDGRGFVPGQQAGAVDGHFGLEGMHDRISRIGGRLTVESRIGGGTTVTATVPTARRDPRHHAVEPVVESMASDPCPTLRSTTYHTP